VDAYLVINLSNGLGIEQKWIISYHEALGIQFLQVSHPKMMKRMSSVFPQSLQQTQWRQPLFGLHGEHTLLHLSAAEEREYLQEEAPRERSTKNRGNGGGPWGVPTAG
jgi:hypothetical protein